MNWYKTATILDDIERQYPLAGDVVDGRVVRQEIPNLSSISASLTEWEELSGIREVSLAQFTLDEAGVTSDARTVSLAQEIKASGEINPLIVVVDQDGPYILEGGHRYDALKILDAKGFPALVIIDMEALESSPDNQPSSSFSEQSSGMI